jgi:hypothetical protein
MQITLRKASRRLAEFKADFFTIQANPEGSGEMREE